MGRDSRSQAALTSRLARLLESQGTWPRHVGLDPPLSKLEGCNTVKKLVLLALVGVGVLAVWKKVQADRAELDLWTEATTSDN